MTVNNGKDRPMAAAVRLDGVYSLVQTPDGYIVVVNQDGNVVGNVAAKGFAALDRLFYHHAPKVQTLHSYPNPSKEQADEVKQRYLNKLAEGWKDKVSEAIKEVMADDEWKKNPASPWDYDEELTGKPTRGFLSGITEYSDDMDEKEDEDETETDAEEDPAGGDDNVPGSGE
jgi:hypothetical protein